MAHLYDLDRFRWKLKIKEYPETIGYFVELNDNVKGFYPKSFDFAFCPFDKMQEFRIQGAILSNSRLEYIMIFHVSDIESLKLEVPIRN